MRLGEILVAAGRVSADAVAAAVAAQATDAGGGLRLGELLVRDGVAEEGDVLAALSVQYGIPLLTGLGEEVLDPALVANLPVEWARANRVLPVRLPDGVRVLMSDPTRVEILDDLALLLGEEAIPVLAPAREIARAIEACYVRRDGSARDFLDALPAGGDPAATEARGRADDLLRVADQAPVTQLVNLILLDAVKLGASDIHIEPYPLRLLVRYRVDGLLYEQSSPPKHLEAALVSRLKVMGRLDIAEKRLPQDGMARVRVGEREIDIRISTIPVAEGERVVLRLLNRESTLLPLADLGMPDTVLVPFRTMLGQPNGIILVTGPTGSGKTTTLYAALGELDTQHYNVLTIEDPIEYQLPGIGQIQVKPKIGLTFAHGLRHILRQDPDVILVGETRDLETAEIVVRASMTGHLVFSTLHTNDAAGAVLRLVDMGIPAYLLAASIRGALAQRLVRVLCPHCRRPVGAEPGRVGGLGAEGARLIGQTVYEPGSCPRCLGGYRGRTGIYELMAVNPDIREAIRGEATPAELAALAERHGMRPLRSDALDKVLAGATSVAELVRAVGMI